MDEETSTEQRQIDPIELFSEGVREPVAGLTLLGKLTDEFEFCGHTFAMRTLLPHEKFAIGQALQPYRNTLVEVDAFRTAHIGMALAAVDNDFDFCPPIDRDIVQYVKARMNYVAQRWYDPVHEYLYSRYRLLEIKAAEAITELDRLSKGSRPDNLSPPWLDSLTEQGGLAPETDSNIPPPIPSN